MNIALLNSGLEAPSVIASTGESYIGFYFIWFGIFAFIVAALLFGLKGRFNKRFFWFIEVVLLICFVFYSFGFTCPPVGIVELVPVSWVRVWFFPQMCGFY